MKGILIGLLLSVSAFADETRDILRQYKKDCKQTVVTVDEIVKDSHIRGHITGLPAEAYADFKVVFYVKTNRWYVHPYTYYEGQEEGYSYSNINHRGEFFVRSVTRKVPSKQMAVVVVPKSQRIYSQKFWLRPLFGIFGGVLKNQCAHTLVKGTGDFFLE
jgi:hypothetical protein